MEVELKEKWCQALESGNYKQATGKLFVEGVGHCCLGVLAEVAGMKINPVTGNDIIQEDEEYNGYAALTTIGVHDSTREELWQLNDISHLTFPEIAKYIRENL